MLPATTTIRINSLRWMKTTSVILKPRLIARSEIVPMMNRIELLFSAWELLLMDQQINFEKLIFSLKLLFKMSNSDNSLTGE